MASSEAFKPHDAQLDQGDILANVPTVKWIDGQPTPGTPARCLVTSHGCTCEDYERAVERGASAADRIFVHAAPLRPATVFRDKVDEIKEGKRLDLFFVKGEGSRLADQVAILNLEQPVPAAVLAGCTKIARIADWQWEALLVHATVSRFHNKPEEIFRDEILKGVLDGA